MFLREQIKEGKSIDLRSSQIKVSIIPEHGGKISSIKSLNSGQEFLIQPESESLSNIRLKHGMEFKPPFSYGFDECFPTVSESTVLIDNKAIIYPDHGELWTASFEHKLIENDRKCLLTYKGHKNNYIFSKEIKLFSNVITIIYRLTNNSDKDFHYLWSAHPLLSVDKGDELLLPEGIKNVEVFYSSKSHWNKGDQIDWPILFNDSTLNFVQNPWAEIALKVFARNLSIGKASLYRAKTNETIQFQFDTYRVGSLGIWLCYGGWPENTFNKDYAVAIEPTNCPTDSLSEAIDFNIQKTLKPHESVSWFQNISIMHGRITP